MSLERDIIDAKTEDERKRIAHEGIRRIIDDTFIPLMSQEPVLVADYGDICFALGYLKAHKS